MESNEKALTHKTLVLYLILAVIASAITNIAVDYVQARRVERVDRTGDFSKVLSFIEQRYVESVDKNKLMDQAVESMLSKLDPYSQYLSEQHYDELLVHTKGEFGGIGIRIAVRDNKLTVIAPMPGTPAQRKGIIAGDQVAKVDGKSTENWSVDQAVEALRGPRGSEVKITIYRPGSNENLDLAITRDVIKIESVPFAFMLDERIGYVNIAEFAERTADDLKDAIQKLRDQGAKALVLDLRNNPGGLLESAIDVSDLFLDKGELIVYTRGRDAEQEQRYQDKKPLLAEDQLLLAVLVNEGSASASEIVAGAIQDHDAGLIIGRPTFGKGSVQSIFRISDTSALKLTTAKYYTPSGRCIHKDHAAEAHAKADSAALTTDQPDSLVQTGPVFKTESGRTVYGGGGITPDILQTVREIPKTVRDILREGRAFDFTVDYVAKNPETGNLPSPQMIDDFKLYLQSKKVAFSDETFSEARSEITRQMRLSLATVRGKEEQAQKITLEDDLQLKQAVRCLSKATSVKALLALAPQTDSANPGHQ